MMSWRPLVLALSAGLVFPSWAEACTCLPPSLTRSWHIYSDTLEVLVLGETTIGGKQYYDAEVLRPFSGCTRPGDRVLIESATNQAACGIRLDLGRPWLVTVSNRDTQGLTYGFRVDLCGYNKPWTDVTDAEKDFLFSRLIRCPITHDEICADGTDPVNCLVDPCDVAICGIEDRCESNDCGGCTAEFYDAWLDPVCTPW